MIIRRLFLALIAFLIGWFVIPAQVYAGGASLLFSPSSKSVTVGSTVTVAIKVNSGGQAMNASEATISFPKDTLRLLTVSTSSSIFTFWAVRPSGSNSTGQVTFSGGLPSPGYSGSSGTVLTMTFQALTAGTAHLTMTGAKVLANDGVGTDVISTVGTGTVTVNAASSTPSSPTYPAPVITSTQYADQSSWYNQDSVTLTWTKPSGVVDFSYDFRQSASNEPDHIADTKDTAVTVSLTKDGAWYFALQAHYASGWSTTTRYRLQYDHTAPEPFTVTVDRDRGESDPTPQLTFSTTDATSGIEKYTLSIDGGAAVTVSSPVTLSDLRPGDHTFVIVAYDKAGNAATSQATTTQVGYPAPTITSVTTPLLLLERLTVHGTAAAGDTVTIYVDGQAVGLTVAGVTDAQAAAEGVRISAPWTFTSDHLWRPGRYQLTAQSTSTDGQTSVMTDPATFVVSGHSVVIGGHTLATVAVVPAGAVLIIVLAVLITLTMVRLLWSVVMLHRHDLQIEEELDDIRKKIKRHQLSDSQTDSALTGIEQELLTPARSRRTRRRSRR